MCTWTWSALTVRNGDNTANGLGGGLQNDEGGVVVLRKCAFYHDYANADGGAIDNADLGGTGTLTVLSTTFTDNYAVNSDGGAIANADLGGRGTVVVSGSTFDSNSAINGDGGAVDNGDSHGDGTYGHDASALSRPGGGRGTMVRLSLVRSANFPGPRARTALTISVTPLPREQTSPPPWRRATASTCPSATSKVAG